MAFRSEKNSGGTNDIVFYDFEKGISASPHEGTANLQNVNLSTEMGEVINSFPRVQDSMTQTSSTGTLTFADSSHVNLNIAGTNNLFKGNWITVSASSNTTQLPNGVYYVPPSTGSTFQLQRYYSAAVTATTVSVSALLVGGGGGGGNYSIGSTSGGGGGGGQVSPVTVAGILSGVNYSIGVGTGGGVGTTTSAGSIGGGSSFGGNTANGGGGGGSTDGSSTTHNATTGAGGGGGGGGYGFGSGAGLGAAGSPGFAGGNGNTVPGNGNRSGAGGGGGAGSIGTNSSDNGSSSTGGNGGTGVSNSLSGSSVSYGGGGGGNGNGSSAIQGTGNGGGGNGMVAGTNGTGGGGGGNAAGGSGIVIISAPIGTITSATGGTHTTSGGNDIWTFTTSGVWVPTIANTAAPTNQVTGLTSGLTATIQLTATMGKPIAKAIETYFLTGTAYTRYYILDNQNLVWVYDSQNETTYSTSDNVGWFLPDYQTGWCTNATGVAVIDGFLVVAAQSGIYGKSVVQLGAINTQTSNWVVFYDNYPWQSGSNAAHFCYVGHQGRLYITDGNYIRSVFPDSTLAQTVNGTIAVTTGDNVQSLASWIVDSSQSGQVVPNSFIIPSVVSGDLPFTSDQSFLPVIFFAQGILPAAINTNQVYFLKQRFITAGVYDFQVYSDTTMSEQNSIGMTETLSSGAQTALLSAAWTHPTGYYPTTFFETGSVTQTINVFFTNGSTAIIWTIPLTNATTTANIDVFGTLDMSTGAVGTQYYSTFYPTLSAADPNGNTPSYVSTPQRLTLPNFEISTCIAEVGNITLVGCKGNVVYPWDQTSNLPSTIIPLPEAEVAFIVTVNQVGYIGAGHKGNLYLTDGSVAAPVISVPDYVAGIPGTPSTYVEPYFTFTDSMYLRGRVYFGLIDQTATKAGNAGGIWSFIPSQNVFLEQDTGLALRLENQNSYGTYNGAASILIPKANQATVGAQYFSGWYSDITTPTYGIDATSATTLAIPTVIETDGVALGTFFEKQTFQQVMYKMATPLQTGETIAVNYRTNLTDAWQSMGTAKTETNTVSGYWDNNFQKVQWVQFQIILTPTTGSSFIRFVELRLR